MSREVSFINKRTIIGAILTVIIIIAAVIIFIPKQSEFPLSSLEQSSVEERTAKVMNYLEEIDNNDQNRNSSGIEVNGYALDRYIAFALEYNYNENDKTEMSASDIKSFLEANFEGEFDEEKINSVGISPLLLDKNVGHDPVGKVYNLRKDYDKRAIANIPVTKYFAKRYFTNKDKTIYTVIYDKYTAKSPYDVLPHISGGTGVKDYLEGKGKIIDLKNAITSENAKEITNPEKETTVEYTLKDNKLVVKTIK